MGPPGYVGHEDGGQLTEPVRRPSAHCHSDEVEKAHPSVFSVLLQLLDDGRLTDSHGRTVDFSSTIVILTSNLGGEHLLHSGDTPKSWEATRERVMGVVKKFFRPEFLNRLDDIVLFRRLGFGELHEIIDSILAEVNGRLKEQQITVIASDAAKSFILESGFDPDMGARPLRRWVEKHITTELSRMIISETIGPNSTVQVNVNPSNSKLTFSVKRASS